MRRKIKTKKVKEENFEHRGNDLGVASKFRLEMRLVKNINKDKPVYSFDQED
jgi:hypothetical protein